MHSRPVIAITGDAGKTTTKEMIAFILQTKYAVFKSYKNGNDPWFTKQYSACIREEHEAIVLEYGLRFPGDIAKMCAMIPPTIGVITNIGDSHIAQFSGDISAVAQEKSELIRALPSNGLLILNADDLESRHLLLHNFSGKILRIGLETKAEYQADDVRYTDSGMSFILKIDGAGIPFQIPLFGKHNVYNALCAIAICHHLGLSLEKIQETLNKFTPLAGRIRIRSLPRINPIIQFIDDSLSAKAKSLYFSMEVLKYKGVGKKIFIFSCFDPLDKGIYAYEQFHTAGKSLTTDHTDYLYTVGPFATAFAHGALEAGFPKDRVYICSDEQSFCSLFLSYEQHFTQEKMTLLLKGRSLSLKLNRFISLFVLQRAVAIERSSSQSVDNLKR